jgi:hypothetical protein
MWLFCCGMPRSASTLQYQIAAELLETRGLGQRIGYADRSTFPTIHRECLTQAGTKVVKIHQYVPQAEDLARLGDALFLYSVRDIRDVVVSRREQARISFEQAASAEALREIIRDHQQWTRLSPILVSRYEEITGNLEREIARIALFLRVTLDPTQVSLLATRFGVEAQRRRVDGLRQGALKASAFKPYDPHSQLHLGHIQSAHTGRWRNELSEEQVALVEARAGRWLARNGYEVSQPLLKRLIARHRARSRS